MSLWWSNFRWEFSENNSNVQQKIVKNDTFTIDWKILILFGCTLIFNDLIIVFYFRKKNQ